jgi:hypothetical protein
MRALERFDEARFRLKPTEKDRIWNEIIADCVLVADCWLYPKTNKAGYGMKYYAGETRTVSRFTLAYVTRESLNIELDACHVGHCPYKNCCNPAHLEWGTHRYNCEQRAQKRRESLESLLDPRWRKAPALGYERHEDYLKCTAYISKFEPESLNPLEELEGRTRSAAGH